MHLNIGNFTYCLKCTKQLSLFDQMPITVYNRNIRLPYFCVQCQYELPIIHHIYCKKCSAYRECYDNCDDFEQLQQNFSCLAYSEDVKEWIRLFKFEGAMKIGEALMPLLAIAVARFRQATNQEGVRKRSIIRGLLAYSENANCCNIVTTVPISQQRLLERGFNQAAHLARYVAKDLNCPFVHLFGVSNSFEHSSHMNKQEREQAVQRKYYCNEQTMSQVIKLICKLKNKRLNIIIVDDIYTTGSTLRACSRLLQHHLGSSCNIYGVTLARA